MILNKIIIIKSPQSIHLLQYTDKASKGFIICYNLLEGVKKIMTLQEWFSMQDELDKYIEEEHGLQNTNLVERKILALLVEIGELANETRCFKFWSKKPASDQAIVLEEFVDGVHFILSIGNELGFSDRDIPIVSSEANEDLVQSFLKIYQLIDKLRQNRTGESFEELMRQYFILGQSLGFSINDVQTAYKEKNEVNYKRQQEGY